MDKVYSFLKAHWGPILAFGAAAWVQFGPSVTAYVSAHPKLAVWFSFASFVVAYYKKSQGFASLLGGGKS
jgi:hypothetical protein